MKLKIVFILILSSLWQSVFAQGEFIIEFDFQNRVIKKVSTKVDDVEYIFPGENTYDENSSIFYFLSSSPKNAIYGISVKTGSTQNFRLNNNISAIEFSNSLNRLFGIQKEQNLDRKRLVAIDFVNNQIIPISQYITSSSMFQGYDSYSEKDTIYTFTAPPNILYSISCSTGKILHSPSIQLSPGLAIQHYDYHPKNGKLYALVSENAGNSVFLANINISTGSVNRIGPSFSGAGIGGSSAVNSNDNTYVWQNRNNGKEVITMISIDNGSVLSKTEFSLDAQDNVIDIEYDHVTNKLYSKHWDAKISNVSFLEQNYSICAGDSVLVNNVWVKETSEIKYDIIETSGKTVVTAKINVHPSYLISQSSSLCKGDSIKFFDTWIEESGIYTKAYKTNKGCDSIFTANISILPSYLIPQSSSLCQGDSLLFFDTWIKQTGFYNKVFKTVKGCDSIYTANITVTPSYLLPQSSSICEGDSLLFFDTWIKQSGLYNKFFKTDKGCDSIYTVNITVNPSYLISQSLSICEGDSVKIGNQTFKQEGNYQIKLASKSGCDSTINLSLSITPILTKNEEYTICSGDSILINNQWIKQSGEIKYDIIEANCKTEVSAKITVNPSYLIPQSLFICQGDSLLINNEWIKDNKEWKYNLLSSKGCDSTILAKVTKLIWPEAPIIELDCEANVYNASIHNISPWKATWSNGDTNNRTTLTKAPAYVKVSHNDDCEKQYDINFNALPDLARIPNFDDEQIKLGESISLKIDLDSAEWQVEWLPGSILDCSDCFSTNIYAKNNVSVTVNLKHENGCIYTQSFDVKVIDDSSPGIIFPNIFKPSSTDNNTWTITLPDGYKIQETKIYDRWGNQVYASTNSINWDGKISGQKVITGVYVYFVKYLNPEGKIVIRRGDVVVVE